MPSGLVPNFQNDLDGVNPSAGLGNGVLPNVSEEMVSPTRARNMKDFENVLYFTLFLFFPNLIWKNIELKVEVESLKRELQEREQLLIKASFLVGPVVIYTGGLQSSWGGRGHELPVIRNVQVQTERRAVRKRKGAVSVSSCRRAETQTRMYSREGDPEELVFGVRSEGKAVESLAEGGGSEIQRVKADARKKDVKAAQAELEKAFAGTETEKALRLSLESKLAEMKMMHEGDLQMVLVLEEKDRLIEELKLSLKSKEALIQCLKEEKSQMASPDASVSSGELRGLSAAPREGKDRETEAAQMEHQKERKHFEERIQALQEDLREKEREIATEKKNSLKRDKAIQGLTVALKSKEKEVEELNSEIQGLSAAIAAGREAPQKAQTRKLQGSEDYEAALSEKEALLAELHSENLTKSAENHRLRRNIKKVTQELSDLQHERERLEKDLEEARRERSKGDCTIRDLKNEVEKLRNEVNERKKTMENRYKTLLSESNKKLHSQEQVIKRLTESVNQKDLLLQKFNEKDLEAIQQNRCLMTAQDLEFRSEGLITEKCSSQQSPGSKIIFSEDKQQSDYEELIQVLRKEQDIYTHLVKSLQDSDSTNSLQAELNSILALRKQLERDVLSYRNLQKTLEEQINEIRRREGTLSPVSDLIQLVKELYSDNQHLKKTIFDLSCMGIQGNGRLESTEQTELLARKEDKDTIKMEEDDENNFLSDQHLEQSNEIMEDYSKGRCKNGYLKHMDSNILDHSEAPKPSCPGDQSMEEGKLADLLAPFFSEKATLLLESRPDLLKALRELLLEQICLAEQEVSGERLDDKTEKTVKQMDIELRGDRGQFTQASSPCKPHGELQSAWETQLARAGEAHKVELRDASVQTVAVEGKTEAGDQRPSEAVISTELLPQNMYKLPRQQAALSCPSGTNKGAKKSRLPILIKPSRPLGSVYHLPASQEVVAQLQGQILELQGNLKEFKTRNKQLHQKLILAEAMMEGKSTPEKTLPDAQPFVGTAYQDSPEEEKGMKATPSIWRDKEMDNDQQTNYEIDSEIPSPDDLAILPARQEIPEDFVDPTSVAASYLSSKNQLSIKSSMVGNYQPENIDTSNDTECLKRKILDLETELEGYRNFLFRLQKHSQCSEAIITVLCGTEEAQEGSNKPKGSTDEEEMTFSSLHQVRYVKHMQILHPLAPEMIEGRMLENLKQQLVEQEYELQKEQNLNMELFSEIHNLQNKYKELSPSRYDSLVQSQARELSLQRQQIKDSHDICVIYRQHVNTMIKAFKELLQASDVDYCVAEGFQEQLHQCAELLEKLEKLFLNGKSVGVEMSTQNELIERIEEDNLTDQHILPESPEPSTSHVLSDYEASEKSSFFSQDQKQDSEAEKTSVIANDFSQDLLMQHIQEIRTLRKRLEESIKTNEKLQKQLERQGSEFDQGSTYGSELHSSLTSEIHFLRKQNQALNAMLVKGSRDKQKENEKLRESLSRKAANLEHLQQEYASVKGENERLQKEVSEKERHNQQLIQEVCSSRSELSRVQEEMELSQQLLSQNEKLLQSLRVELKVYEKLDEEHRRPGGARAEASGEGQKRQSPFSDLHGLLMEIQALRVQLERSIETNRALQHRLEEQLVNGMKTAQAGALTLAVLAPSTPERSLQLDKHGEKCLMASDNSFDLFDSTLAMIPKSASETLPLSGNDKDSLSSDSGSSVNSTLCVPPPVTGCCLWASESGWDRTGPGVGVREQIGQGQRLLAKMDNQIQDVPSPTDQELETKQAPLSKFLTSVSTAKLVLEEASRLLKRLWRVALPTGGQCTLHCEQIGEMKAEITKLHKKLFEQEKKLQSTVKLLQLSKHQEKVIFDQLVVTHKILRKARGNLESCVRVVVRKAQRSAARRSEGRHAQVLRLGSGAPGAKAAHVMGFVRPQLRLVLSQSCSVGRLIK
ncbi:CDK5 regulatory subunit-associated protein 2 [Tupaia chinensis]|uniref:CDK5 regulatory subunit-associated protein 2 n=1 Tax=Tupaia chinensis TaxID=246437 RepID=L9K3Q0_TUPCH|nr:CDK5 regulatory subunit-associated protein 2 [Tupaia chinensis]